MPTECFVAATKDPEVPSNRSTTGIHFHELQPASKLKSSLKKSSIKPHCLAIGPTHVFAAQVDKGVIHVYNRDSSKQEAVVPFPQRISSIALAGESHGCGTLIIGTEAGGLILWTPGSGRQISTPKHHLHEVTCLAVNARSEFVLSGSADTNLHLWALPELLSFSSSSSSYGGGSQRSPRRTLSSHREAVNDVCFGHSHAQSNIAVSIARDRTCNVWNPEEGSLLCTFLLSVIPLCLALDPVDRAVYVGLEDGSLQLINFYKTPSITQLLHDNDRQAASADKSDRWVPQDQSSPVQCVAVSYDSTRILCGHVDGKIYQRQIFSGKFDLVADHAAPITNLIMLIPAGFRNSEHPQLKLHQVVKPTYDNFSKDPAGGLQSDWSITAQIASKKRSWWPGEESDDSVFYKSLTHASFPGSLLRDCLAQLHTKESQPTTQDSEAVAALQAQNAALNSSLEETKRRVRELDGKVKKRYQDDEVKITRKRKRRERRRLFDESDRKKEMGEPADIDDMDMGGAEEDGDLSSDTDELTDSG